MKKIIRVFLVVLICFGNFACQSKPKSKPLTEMSDAELVDHYKNAPVSKVETTSGGSGWDWGDNIFADTGYVIIMIPVVIVMVPYYLITSGAFVLPSSGQHQF